MSMRYPGGLIATSPVNARYPSGVWTQAQAAPYQAQNVWTRDQFWPYTTLLLQGDGATNGAQNNTFLDSSSNNFTITRNGNTTQGAFTPYEATGYWSAFFAGGASGGYITSSTSADYAFGTGDFTIEGFVFVTGTGTGIFQQGTSNFPTSTTNTVALGTNGGTPTWQMYARNAATNSTATWVANTWYHFAVVRSGTTTTLYINGSSVITVTSDNTNYTGTNFGIGSIYGTGSTERFTGYLSNLRVVKGAAVYTANFTPPTSPLTVFSSGTTALIALQSNRYIDTSASPKTLTATDSASVQSFQPFPGATTWSASVLGGSGYFDGSGDYLSATMTGQTPGTGSFTYECWFYLGSLAAARGIMNTRSGDTTDGFDVTIQTNGNVYISYTNSVLLDAAAGVKPQTWYHLAVVRNGSTNWVVYLNGASIGTISNSSNFTSTTLFVGAVALGGSSCLGYIADFRYARTAVYTAAFTPPSAPLTAIANTAFLASFTNAGIYDNSMMNNLETVGNAQVSTSVVKYGTGSMAFDGSGDYLLGPSSENYAFRTGDFTVECWVYITANQSFATLIDTTGNGGASASFGWLLEYSASRGMVFFIGNSGAGTTLTFATTPATGVWTHLAATRSGSTLRLFINGTSVASGTYTNDITMRAAASVSVGAAGGNQYLLNGYIDDLRVTKGAARYITTFTPPIARLPAQ